MKNVPLSGDAKARRLGRILTAAVAGMVTAGTLGGCSGEKAASSMQKSAIEKHACKGLNSCKGQGGCAVEGKHACAGQNACKGQGGCATVKHACKGQNACKGQGGCKTASHACKGLNSCKGQGGCKVG